MKTIKFDGLPRDREGLILLGCGGDLAQWDEGVRKLIQEEGIGNPEDFEEAQLLTTTGGRQDILLLFAKKHKLNIGKLAIWRLGFGDCCWLSDYLTNYAKHHRMAPDEPEEVDEDPDEEK